MSAVSASHRQAQVFFSFAANLSYLKYKAFSPGNELPAHATFVPPEIRHTQSSLLCISFPLFYLYSSEHAC
jgi:hypothetical protein